MSDLKTAIKANRERWEAKRKAAIEENARKKAEVLALWEREDAESAEYMTQLAAEIYHLRVIIGLIHLIGGQESV